MIRIFPTYVQQLSICGIAREFKTSVDLVRKCFRNGHYSRGILAAALCEKLNEEATYEVSGDYYYDVNYEELGEKISLEKKNKEGEVLKECSFYDLELDKGHYGKPFDGENIFAEVITGFFVIKVYFYVPCLFL